MLITCIGIFFARAIDVTFGTLKTIYMVKGKALKTAIIAFVEVFIWFVVAREALNTEINSLWIPISYALGYSTGTLVGTFISNHFVSGLVCVQVITKKDNSKLIETLREKGYGISIMELKNDYDKVKREMLLIEIQKKSLKELKNIIELNDPSAFIIVNDSKVVHNGQVK